MAIQNPEAANHAVEAKVEKEEQEREEIRENEQTRGAIEGGPEPNDDAPETVDDVVPTGGYTMSIDRRVGSTHLDVAYYDSNGEDREGRFKFGKPNGLASREIFGPLDDQNEEEDVEELTDFVWGTLAEWCVESEAEGVDVAPDEVEFWARTMGLGDAMTIVQDLAIGGVGPEP